MKYTKMKTHSHSKQESRELVKICLQFRIAERPFSKNMALKLRSLRERPEMPYRDFVNASDINFCSPGCGHHPVGGLSI